MLVSLTLSTTCKIGVNLAGSVHVERLTMGMCVERIKLEHGMFGNFDSFDIFYFFRVKESKSESDSDSDVEPVRFTAYCLG